jgi:glycine hydroxymethyltransferase
MNITIRDQGFFTETLATRDPVLHAAMQAELKRQRKEIELIA